MMDVEVNAYYWSRSFGSADNAPCAMRPTPRRYDA